MGIILGRTREEWMTNEELKERVKIWFSFYPINDDRDALEEVMGILSTAGEQSPDSEQQTDMGKWLYRFYYAWKQYSDNPLDKEAEESYQEICKRLERTMPQDSVGVVDEEIKQIIESTLEAIRLTGIYSIYGVRTKLQRIKQLLQQPKINVPIDEDTILKIFEIYEEPELLGWKIGKVQELLKQWGKSSEEVDVENLAEKLVSLSHSIIEQSGDTQKFLKAKRWIEDNLQ